MEHEVFWNRNFDDNSASRQQWSRVAKERKNLLQGCIFSVCCNSRYADWTVRASAARADWFLSPSKGQMVRKYVYMQFVDFYSRVVTTHLLRWTHDAWCMLMMNHFLMSIQKLPLFDLSSLFYNVLFYYTTAFEFRSKRGIFHVSVWFLLEQSFASLGLLRLCLLWLVTEWC